MRLHAAHLYVGSTGLLHGPKVSLVLCQLRHELEHHLVEARGHWQGSGHPKQRADLSGCTHHGESAWLTACVASVKH